MNLQRGEGGVVWSEEDQEYVGLCAEMPSLSWLEKSQDAALRGIVAAAREKVSLNRLVAAKLTHG